jgi:hypothetical protein
VLVGLRRRLPAPHLVDRQASLDELAGAGPFEQLLGDLGGTVGERRHAHPGVCELADSVPDVRVHVQLAEAGDDVLSSLVGIAAQCLDMGEPAAEHPERDGAEVGVGAGGGEREAVAEGAREPELEQLAGSAHLLEAGAQRLQVGERLVDVEQHERRSRHGGLLLGLNRACPCGHQSRRGSARGELQGDGGAALRPARGRAKDRRAPPGRARRRSTSSGRGARIAGGGRGPASSFRSAARGRLHARSPDRHQTASVSTLRSPSRVCGGILFAALTPPLFARRR